MFAGLASIPWLIALAAVAVAVWQYVAAVRAKSAQVLAQTEAAEAKGRVADLDNQIAILRRLRAADAVRVDSYESRIAELEKKLLERAKPGDGQAALATGFGEKKP